MEDVDVASQLLDIATRGGSNTLVAALGVLSALLQIDRSRLIKEARKLADRNEEIFKQCHDEHSRTLTILNEIRGSIRGLTEKP